MFVTSDSDEMSHGAIGSALTSSFNNGNVFRNDEYTRVCPTRICCTCATFGCHIEGIDSAYFAKQFMKNNDTTNIHYNLFSNNREALKLTMQISDNFQAGGKKKLAMQIGDNFQAGGKKRNIYKQELDIITI